MRSLRFQPPGSTLFIADSGNCRVAVWDTAPALRYRYSIGRRGSGDGQLLRPSGLAVVGRPCLGHGHPGLADERAPGLADERRPGPPLTQSGPVPPQDAEHVYVADSGNHRVCKFTRAGAFCLAVGGYGEAPGCFRLPRGPGPLPRGAALRLLMRLVTCGHEAMSGLGVVAWPTLRVAACDWRPRGKSCNSVR